MSLQRFEIQRLQHQANAAMEQYMRSGDLNSLYQMIEAHAAISHLAIRQLMQDTQNNAKIQIMAQQYQTWMEHLKSCKDQAKSRY